MPAQFRVGIVGAVSAYTLHYGRALSEMPGVTLAGLAHLGRDTKYIEQSWNLPWLKRYPKTLDGYVQAFGAPLYESAEEMFADAELDAVCVTTEDYLHLHYALLAIEHGLHVFVPKPFASSHEEAVRMFDAARAKGVILLPSLPNRHRPGYVLARQAVEEGAIGRPISGHFGIEHHLTLGGWKSDPSMAAGPEYEMGFYVFDALRWMMNSEARRVVAAAANLDHCGIPYIDNAKAMVECENGALASVDMRFSMHHRFVGNAMEVVGDEGALRLEDGAEGTQQVLAIYTRSGVKREPLPAWDAEQRELGQWLALSHSAGDAQPWQEEALRTLDLIAVFKRAYQCGEPVILPLADAAE